MRQFNYYGRTRLDNLDEHDIVGLEKEIENILKTSLFAKSPPRQQTTQGTEKTIDYASQNIVNINDGYQLPQKRLKSAGHAYRPRGKKGKKSGIPRPKIVK